MDITISKHAAERIAERGITEEGIKAIVDGGADTYVIPSITDANASVMYGIYNGKLWTVVINDNTKNVITVRRARKDEENKYYDR